MVPPIEFDTILELCQDQHRRILLAVLTHERRSLTIHDLTKTIGKHNHHMPVREIPKEETTKIQVALHHTHIPKLEALSLVEYDQERQLVVPTPQFDQVRPQLSAIIDADPGLEEPVTL